MRIAILGATSQIAKDLIFSFAEQGSHELVLFARSPEAVKNWLASVGLFGRFTVADFDSFKSDENFEAIINFVGSGNPAQTAAMGVSIFDITYLYDEMALGYIKSHPDCRYLFLSSGAAYGSSFEEPANEDTKATIAINKLMPQDWYAVAKLYAECRHRAHWELHIIDIRIFNYFSHTQDISARFLVTDCLRSIKSSVPLIVSPENMLRDYIGPEDFFQFVLLVLRMPAVNMALDCYSRSPVDKFTLLANLHEKFGLLYDFHEASQAVNATGVKSNYYSTNRRAGVFGYVPTMSSLENVVAQARLMLNLV